MQDTRSSAVPDATISGTKHQLFIDNWCFVVNIVVCLTHKRKTTVTDVEPSETSVNAVVFVKSNMTDEYDGLTKEDLKRYLIQSEHIATVMYLDAREYLKDIDPSNETHSFTLTANMYDLVVKFRRNPIGSCDACGTRSPLRAGKHEGLDAMVCAWDEGCQ